MAYKLWTAGDVLTADDLNNSFDASGWTSYTPTLSGLTLGTGGVMTARYAQIGKTLLLEFLITFGTGGAIPSQPSITVPSGKNIKTAMYGGGFGTIYNASTNYPMLVTNNGATSLAFYIMNSAGTYVSWTGPAGVFTIASGNQLSFRAFYEVA